jgi:AcrR family transcriptional regulator
VGRGLTPAVVVATAVDIADDAGIDAVSMGAVAAALGVRTPSLYNHVSGLAGLRRALALRGLGELGDRLRDAGVGRSGDDALFALADAYRAYARESPGLYAAIQRAPEEDDAEMQAAAAVVLRPVLAVLAGCGLTGDDAVHAARAFRSALHGFADLERAGGFGIDLDVGASHRFMVAALGDGLRARGRG